MNPLFGTSFPTVSALFVGVIFVVEVPMPRITTKMLPNSLHLGMRFFHRTTSAVHDDANYDKVSIGTWNINALAPHVHEIIAREADIIALQEVRIGADSVPGMRSIFKQYGYNLHFSGLPKYKEQGHNKKTIHLEQTVPGVAFAIRPHIPVQEISVEPMGNWFQKGWFLTAKTFVQQRWITCFNIYAPTQNTAPFLDELLSVLEAHNHDSCVLFGDINADSRNGHFVQNCIANGWFPLTYSTNFDFFTYKHSNGNTSCIDILAVTDLLKETIAPIQATEVLDKGYSFIHTSIHNSFQKNTHVGGLSSGRFQNTDTCESEWPKALAAYTPKMAETSVDQDWEVWCQAFQEIHNPSGAIMQLGQAIKNQDWQQRKNILSKLQQISKNQLTKWRLKIRKSGQPQHSWIKTSSDGPELRHHLFLLVSRVKNMVRKALQIAYMVLSLKSRSSLKMCTGAIKRRNLNNKELALITAAMLLRFWTLPSI